MSFDIVYGSTKNSIAIENLKKTLLSIFEITEDEGTLFLGYPLTVKIDEAITVDALLVTKKKGVTAIIIHEKSDNDRERQDKMYFDLKYAFSKYDKLREGRELVFSPNVLTYFSDSIEKQSDPTYNFVNETNFRQVYLSLNNFDERYYPVLCESLYRISSMKPRKKRQNIQKPDSKGAKIKQIEKEIANLDEWQKKAAYEVPDGPQQIRGLAGSGKTVVLALKAAYLHSQHPDWNIIVTFYTRALKQQYIGFINNFMTDFSDDKPDWEKLSVVHAWGTGSEVGVYSIAASQSGMPSYNYNAAKQKYGEKSAFSGICGELLNGGFEKRCSKKYDAILIDEAQDLPEEFFRLCYAMADDKKRIIFAYDELQNLGNVDGGLSQSLFGTNEDGSPKVILANEEGKPRQDIVLPICYRNTKWALTIAHALGFGIYRKEGMIQAFSSPQVWKDIGYEIKSGYLEKNKKVKLQRDEKSTPKYFSSLISAQEAFQTKIFADAESEYAWMAKAIKRDIETEELDPDDILVIFPDAYTSQGSYNTFRRYLAQEGLDSILAGITTNRDTFKVKDAITCASIYRAKGNEFPMVYVANAQHCYSGSNIITLRNALFTAITRARAWVTVVGYGEEMVLLDEEIQKCISKDFVLDFKNPSDEELSKMRSLYKELSKENASLIDSSERNLKQLRDLLRKGEIKKEALTKLLEIVEDLDD